MRIKQFTFNPFYENTYILYDETNECVIIDPGCITKDEQNQLSKFIEEKQLKPLKLLNTHCHIDHIFGNSFVAEKYALALETNEKEIENILAADIYSSNYGVPSPRSPKPEKFLNEGDIVEFGNTKLDVLFTPGHSAGHIVFYCEKENIVIGGDVLFNQSIGRTDLPGGDFDTLINSIKKKLFVLPDDTTVYPGHGPHTSIGYEKEHNPFID